MITNNQQTQNKEGMEAHSFLRMSIARGLYNRELTEEEAKKAIEIIGDSVSEDISEICE